MPHSLFKSTALFVTVFLSGLQNLQSAATSRFLENLSESQEASGEAAKMTLKQRRELFERGEKGPLSKTAEKSAMSTEKSAAPSRSSVKSLAAKFGKSNELMTYAQRVFTTLPEFFKQHSSETQKDFIAALERNGLLQDEDYAFISSDSVSEKLDNLNRQLDEQDAELTHLGEKSGTFVHKVDIPVGSRAIFIGDIHGSIHELTRMMLRFHTLGYLNDDFTLNEPYYLVFTGDYVDRGQYGLEVWDLLITLKSKNMDRVFLIKGNHEEPAQNTNNFEYELKAKYPAASGLITEKIQGVYSKLPIALFITCGDKRIIACHGSPDNRFDPTELLEYKGSCKQYISGVLQVFNWGDFSLIEEDGKISLSCGHREEKRHRDQQAGRVNDVSAYLEKYRINAIFRGHQDTCVCVKTFPQSKVFALIKENQEKFLSENSGNLEVLKSLTHDAIQSVNDLIQKITQLINKKRGGIFAKKVTFSEDELIEAGNLLIKTLKDSLEKINTKEMPDSIKDIISGLALPVEDLQALKDESLSKLLTWLGEYDKQIHMKITELRQEFEMKSVAENIPKALYLHEIYTDVFGSTDRFKHAREEFSKGLWYYRDAGDFKPGISYGISRFAYPVFTGSMAVASQQQTGGGCIMLHIEKKGIQIKFFEWMFLLGLQESMPDFKDLKASRKFVDLFVTVDAGGRFGYSPEPQRDMKIPARIELVHPRQEEIFESESAAALSEKGGADAAATSAD